jgi:Ca2+-binding EF-hand superfamily protein
VSIEITENELRFITERFDKNNDGKITLDEFMNEFLPQMY